MILTPSTNNLRDMVSQKHNKRALSAHVPKNCKQLFLGAYLAPAWGTMTYDAQHRQ